MKAPISNVDFGKTADDYVTHRAGFPKSLFSRLIDLGIGTGGQYIVDLGTGTGTLGRGFARAANTVVGIDPSEEMLAAAMEVDRSVDLTTTYFAASAENTGLDEASADIVAAGQCWHWFDSAAACREVRRILKPGGKLVVAHYDWLPVSGNVVRRTEKLIEAHNPDWKGGNGSGIHPWLFRDLAEGGFHNLQSFTYDEPAIYSHEGWRGRIRASAGIAATLSKDAVLTFDMALADLLASDFPEEPLVVPHRVFALVADRDRVDV